MSTALLSIHPRYAEAILSGKKQVEFRRKPFKQDVNCVVIYASSPIMKIVGYFEINSVEITNPDIAWRRFGKVGSISKSEFYNYYADSKIAVAIQIKEAFRFDTPFSIEDLDSDISAPQSFRYLTSELFLALVNKSRIDGAISA